MEGKGRRKGVEGKEGGTEGRRKKRTLTSHHTQKSILGRLEGETIKIT